MLAFRKAQSPLQRTPLNAWYGDATPSGDYAVLIPDREIKTSRGIVPLPGENVLFLVCGVYEGVLCLAGQGGASGSCLAWNSLINAWSVLCPTYGTSPCAFGPQGLYVSMPAATDNVAVFNPRTLEKTGSLTQPLGARGIASVDSRGVHSVDGWYGLGGMAEAIDLDGAQVGQSFDGGCLINGRLLEPGNVQFIRAHREGDNLSVAMWKLKEGLCVLFWLTISEIVNLPLPPHVDNPPKPPDPPKPPEPTPMPKTVPMHPRVPQIVQALYERNVSLAEGDDDQRRALQKLICEQARFELGPQWGWKDAGGGRPPSKDAIAFQDSSGLYAADCFNGSTRKPQVPNVLEEIAGQHFIEVQPVNHLGQEPPKPDPQPDLSAILKSIEELRQQVKALLALQTTQQETLRALDVELRQRVDAIENKSEPNLSGYAKKGDAVTVSGKVSFFGVNRWTGTIDK